MFASIRTTDLLAGTTNPCTDFDQNDLHFYQELKAENHQAFSCLFLRMHNRFVPMACQRGGSYEEAVDVLNDCMAIFLHKIRLGEYAYQPTTKITTYLYSICYHQWLNYVNRRQQRAEVPLNWNASDEEESETSELPVRTLLHSPFVAIFRDSDGEEREQAVPIRDDAEMEMDALEWIPQLKKAFSALREDCQKVLQWFYQEDLSLREIAQRLRMTEQSAAVKRFKCAKYLRDKYSMH